MRTLLLSCALLGLSLSGSVAADMYMVTTSEGPGFTNPDEVAEVLEKGILPTFDMLMDLKAKKKIVVGGLPVGSRTLYLIVKASSHNELDRMLRGLPAWDAFSWQVTPLESLESRAAMERQILTSLKPDY